MELADGAGDFDIVANPDSARRCGGVDENSVRRRVVGRREIAAGARGLDVEAREAAGGKRRRHPASGGDSAARERTGGSGPLDFGDGLGGGGGARVHGTRVHWTRVRSAAGRRRRDGGAEREVGRVAVAVGGVGAVEALDVGVPGGCGRGLGLECVGCAVAEQVRHVAGFDHRTGGERVECRGLPRQDQRSRRSGRVQACGHQIGRGEFGRSGRGAVGAALDQVVPLGRDAAAQRSDPRGG